MEMCRISGVEKRDFMRFKFGFCMGICAVKRTWLEEFLGVGDGLQVDCCVLVDCRMRVPGERVRGEQE